MAGVGSALVVMHKIMIYDEHLEMGVLLLRGIL